MKKTIVAIALAVSTVGAHAGSFHKGQTLIAEDMACPMMSDVEGFSARDPKAKDEYMVAHGCVEFVDGDRGSIVTLVSIHTEDGIDVAKVITRKGTMMMFADNLSTR